MQLGLVGGLNQGSTVALQTHQVDSPRVQMLLGHIVTNIMVSCGIR